MEVLSCTLPNVQFQPGVMYHSALGGIDYPTVEYLQQEQQHGLLAFNWKLKYCVFQVRPSPSVRCWSWLMSGTELRRVFKGPVEEWGRVWSLPTHTVAGGEGASLPRPTSACRRSASEKKIKLMWEPFFKANDKPRWSPHESAFSYWELSYAISALAFPPPVPLPSTLV